MKFVLLLFVICATSALSLPTRIDNFDVEVSLIKQKVGPTPMAADEDLVEEIRRIHTELRVIIVSTLEATRKLFENTNSLGAVEAVILATTLESEKKHEELQAQLPSVPPENLPQFIEFIMDEFQGVLETGVSSIQTISRAEVPAIQTQVEVLGKAMLMQTRVLFDQLAVLMNQYLLP